MTASQPESVFLDTCVLLNYVNRHWEGDKVTELLHAGNVEHVISDTVAEEFETVCDRRREIYPEMVTFLLEEDEDVTAFDPDETELRTAGNDRRHVRTIQFELAEIADDRREVLRLLRRFLRDLEVAVERVNENIVDRVVGPCGPITLSFRVSDVVKNAADVKVVCDAAQWAADGGSGVFVTLDAEDILDKAEEINETLEREQSPDWCLEIVDPRDIGPLSPDTAIGDD